MNHKRGKPTAQIVVYRYRVGGELVYWHNVASGLEGVLTSYWRLS